MPYKSKSIDMSRVSPHYNTESIVVLGMRTKTMTKVYPHLLFEEVLTFDQRTKETLLLLVLQLRVGLLEVFD